MEVAAAWGRAFAIPSRSAITSKPARERQEEAGVARVRRDAKPPPGMQDAVGVAAGARAEGQRPRAAEAEAAAADKAAAPLRPIQRRRRYGIVSWPLDRSSGGVVTGPGSD